MKSVMISIKPKWCELIANGKKTIEIRKTKPKIETPFKCYIYCTKDKIDTSPKTIWWKANSSGFRYIMNGKVIGEFVCDEIRNCTLSNLLVKEDAEKLLYGSCLSSDEISEYLGYKKGTSMFDFKYHCFYGWHISELKIYDDPKELCEFSAIDNHAVKKCQNRIEIYYMLFDLEFIKSDYYCARNNDRCIECKHKMISKPPTSWCYVDELR